MLHFTQLLPGRAPVGGFVVPGTFTSQSGHGAGGIALDVAAAEVGAVLDCPRGCGLLRTPEAHQRLAAGSTCGRHTKWTEQTVPHQVQYPVDQAMREHAAIRCNQRSGTSSREPGVKGQATHACMGR